MPDPTFRTAQLALQLLALAHRRGLTTARRLADSPVILVAVLGLCLGRSGHTDEACAVGRRTPTSLFSLELARRRRLRDRDLTIRYLERAVEARGAFCLLSAATTVRLPAARSRFLAIERTIDEQAGARGAGRRRLISGADRPATGRRASRSTTGSAVGTTAQDATHTAGGTKIKAVRPDAASTARAAPRHMSAASTNRKKCALGRRRASGRTMRMRSVIMGNSSCNPNAMLVSSSCCANTGGGPRTAATPASHRWPPAAACSRSWPGVRAAGVRPCVRTPRHQSRTRK